jgi:prepilin-type N-terminal cleavage/methylation domain-containing protein
MRTSHRNEVGFTLIEALIAIVILAVGQAALANQLQVGGTSNHTANHMSATTAEAIETLEALKAIPFGNLAVGGDLDLDQPAICQPDCEANPDDCPTACVVGRPAVPIYYNYYRTVPGVGLIRTRWLIADPIPGAGSPPVCYITVRSESVAPIAGGFRSRAEFSTFRTCTTAGCPLNCL